jgi:carboxymethylenebutenolidase
MEVPMCYEPSARPPPPPIAGGAATGSTVRLISSDGTEFAAFQAHAEGPTRTGIVILPDVRGLHPFYEDLALRFGEAGVHAVAIDYFGRTAGCGRRDDDFDFWPHVRQTHPDRIAEDTATAVAHLRGTGVEAVFTIGFCFGGRASFDQATRGHGLAGVIGFYGRVAPRDDEDTDAPILKVSQISCPVLGLFGGADEGIPVNDVERFRDALEGAAVSHDVVIYPEAPHSFFDRRYDEHKDACDDAWRRILGFLGADRSGPEGARH